jgi:hypothetical protein
MYVCMHVWMYVVCVYVGSVCVYVCLWMCVVCVYVCSVCVYVCLWMYVCECVCMYLSIYLCMHVCLPWYVWAHTWDGQIHTDVCIVWPNHAYVCYGACMRSHLGSPCTYIHMYVCMYACVYVCMYACVSE